MRLWKVRRARLEEWISPARHWVPCRVSGDFFKPTVSKLLFTKSIIVAKFKFRSHFFILILTSEARPIKLSIKYHKEDKESRLQI